MQYWLVKSEPEAYSWSQLVADKRTDWTGVRNYAARNFLRAMQTGDLVLYYHSGEDKAVVGTAKVSREAFADPTAQDGDWSAVEIQAVRALAQPVALATLRADPGLKDLVMLRQSRLSVSPVTTAEYQQVLDLAGPPTRKSKK